MIGTDLKHRPKSLEDVRGQEKTVKAISRYLKKHGPPRATLLCGQSGSGKTTVARILASLVGCKEQYILEVNGSRYTGLEDARELEDQIKYKSIGSPYKFLIMEEVQRLRGTAWDLLLKIVEEPPNHLFMAFTTTEPDSIPDAMLSRLTRFNFVKIKHATIIQTLKEIKEKESFVLPDGTLELIADVADGNLRKAIKDLEKCDGAEDIEEVNILLGIELGDPKVIDLCRLIVSREANWNEAKTLLSSLKGLNPEGIRIHIANYLTACAVGGSKDSQKFLPMLETFSDPLPNQAGFAKLVVLVADCILNKE